ncbi:hypothetical protein RDI58_013537 [Solanum bulbocastanum]|uniref:Uncharacterized protein n=1 Tax=Solanum bulbocastanum TaxID=147425 RepID=A0AAN8TQX8_SOLBU
MIITPVDDDDDDDKPEEKGIVVGKEKEHLQWKRRDELVKGWIFGSLSDQLLQDKAIHKSDTARQVWLVLEQRYTPKSEGTKSPSLLLYLFGASETEGFEPTTLV